MKDVEKQDVENQILALVQMLEYVRPDVANVRHSAGLAMDLAVAILKEKAGERPGTDR